MTQATPDFTAPVPVARSGNLLSREEGDELLLFDETRSQVHRLNHCAASVWHLCDGRRTVSDIVRHMRETQPTPIVTEDTVHEALDLLTEANLFELPPVEAPPVDAAPQPRSRRTLIRRAVTAGAALAVPMVISLSIPKTGFAQGVIEGGPCDDYSSCPEGFTCCHRPGYGAGVRCWSHPDLCVR